MRLARPKLRSILAFALLLALGIWLRTTDLPANPPSGDEAESAINALTILQHGVPIDHYLGLPIYENTLTEYWPDNPEYEFRDSSYSKRGLAIYHGWLPLYSMAGSFALMGITPDDLTSDLTVQHSEEQMRRRVIAARLPSILFAALFLIVLFFAARDMGGAAAGWAALGAGAIGKPLVWMGREARYHSATLLFSTACCWAIWRARQHGRWRDFILLGLLLALLFHTHLVSFAVACVMLVCLIPSLLRHRQRRLRCAAAAGIVALATVPWLIATGFFGQTPHIPPARAFLSFPADLIYYPLLVLPAAIVPIAGALWLLAVLTMPRRLPRAAVWPILRRKQALLFLLAWLIAGYAVFTLMVPAASYFYKRMALAVLGPGVVWAAVLTAALLRSCKPRPPVALAPAALMIAVTATGMSYLWWLETPDTAAYEMVQRLRQMPIASGTKIYCTPNDQFTLSFLTGLPIQSVAPVRTSFLDSYQGPILIIESAVPYEELRCDEIATVAAHSGEAISEKQARDLEPTLATQLVRERLKMRAKSIVPPLEPLTPLARAVRQYHLEKSERFLNRWLSHGASNPLVRSFAMPDRSVWWQIFFYRFVNPAARMYDNLNYAQRIRSARAEVLRSSWVIFDCPALGGPRQPLTVAPQDHR